MIPCVSRELTKRSSSDKDAVVHSRQGEPNITAMVEWTRQEARSRKDNLLCRYFRTSTWVGGNHAYRSSEEADRRARGSRYESLDKLETDEP